MIPISPTKKHGNDTPCAVVSPIRSEQQSFYHASQERTRDSSTTCTTDSANLPFPWQLHAMLEAAANEAFEHIVSWHDNNSSFKVHDPTLFVQHVMPRFFKRQSKYKSFQRQLNIWQFERMIGSRGPCNGGYFHLFFHRYDTTSFHLMKRSKLLTGVSQPPLCSQQISRTRTTSGLEISVKSTLLNPSKCLSTSEQPVCPNNYLPCMFFSQQTFVGSKQEIGSTSALMILDENNHLTPHDDSGAVVRPSDHESSVWSQMGTSKTQDHANIVAREEIRLSSLSSFATGMMQNLCQCEDEDENELIIFPKDCLSYNWNDSHEDESQVTKIPPTHNSCVLTSLVGRTDLCDGQPRRHEGVCTDSEVLRSSVLSAAELKYVLVGIKIAMTAG